MITTVSQSAFPCINNNTWRMMAKRESPFGRNETMRRRTRRISCYYQSAPRKDGRGGGSRGKGYARNTSPCSGSRSKIEIERAGIFAQCDEGERGISNGFYRRPHSWMSATFLVFTIFTLCLINLPLYSAAKPTPSPDTCGQVTCKAESGPLKDFKFHFKPGGVYSYAYTVNASVYIDGGAMQQSGLHLSANATIRFLTPCDAILYMKDVELWQSVLPSGQDDIHKHHFSQARTRETFKESLEQFPLRFSFSDGMIEEICPYPEEAGWVLNIKRGVLSAFQNTMRRLDLEHRSDEEDVNGRCKVEYKLGEATSSTLTIERVKDINSCGDKFGVFSSIQGTPYSFGNLQQSMPAVQSGSECSQVIDRNLIVEVTCSERHHLTPLSQGVSGVHISIHQHLDLITAYNGGSSLNRTEEGSSDKENEDDDFDLDDEEEEEEGESGKKGSEPEIEDTGTFLLLPKPDDYVAEIISKSLAEILRRERLPFHHEYHVGSSTNDYNTASNALVKFCQAVKMNVDGSAGSLFESLVHALRGLSSKDMMHLSREASALCEGDRSLFDNVLEAVGSAASVGVIKDRIGSGDAPRETISSWINSLTFIPKPDLALMAAAVPILRVRDNYPNILLSYSSLAHTFCRQHTQCENYQPIQILGKLYEKFFNLTGCSTKQRKNVDQALMYLKGIGNFGMFSEGIHSSLQTCINFNDGAEIQIAAIEAYRRMPCSAMNEVVNDLHRIFENQQEDSEVRIAAFLAIMKCPTYPTIRWLKRCMEKEQVRQVTSFVSSYIRNLQESSLPSKLELQGLVSDEKFNDPFPTDLRQFSKNFEASAFSSDGNLGAGLESNLIFSQGSYIPRSSSLNLTVDLFGESVNLFEGTLRVESFEHYVESIFGPNGKLSGSKIHNLVSSLRREKRAVPSKRKMRTLALEYDAMRRYYSDPIVSISIKTLGNEIAFLRKVGLDEQLDSLSSLNPFQFLEKLSNTKDSNWQKSTMLFDSSYIIPTGVGLALNLSAQASSIMRFQAESMIDATNFRANPFQLKLKGRLVPSALVTVSAGVSLSAFETHAGIKVRAKLRSSTALQGSFEVRGGELVDVEFGVPKTKLELVEFRSDLLFLQGNEFRAVEKSPKLTHSCNTGLLYKYMGLKLCTSSDFSPPIVPPSDGVEDHPTLKSAMTFLLNGPSHFSVTMDKANPNLLKTRFHYQWNNNETVTDFKLRTVRTTGETLANSKEDELGIKYLFNKDDNKFTLDVNLPRATATASGQAKKEKSMAKLDVSEKASGKPYMGLSLSLDSLTFTDDTEDQDKSSSSTSSTAYTGTGDVFYKDWGMDVQMQGSSNASRLVVDGKGSYRSGGGKSSEIINLQISVSNQEERRHGQLLGIKRDTRMAVDFTQFPDYNSLFIWKFQSSEDGYQNDIDFRQGNRYLSESDPTTFRILARAYHETNHEKMQLHWRFFATQPSQQTDWGVEASFSSHGKSFDSAISFRYAPGKSYGTSLSLKRKPGVMLLMDLGWNVTLPDKPSMHISLHLEEKAPRIYQAQYKLDWFGTNDLALDIEFSDRSRRNKVDTSCTLIITTKTIDNLKLGFHYLSEEKETKLQLNSEYHNRRNALEVGHIGFGGRKHKVYASVSTGEIVYLVLSELDLEHGIQCSIQTDFGPQFSDILMRIRATYLNGMGHLNLEYSWNTLNPSKRFLFEVSLNSSAPNYDRFEGVVSFPGYNYFSVWQHVYNTDDRSRRVMGRLKWKEEEHLHVNVQLVPRISDHEAYDVLLEVATPFELVKNVSFNVGIQFFKDRHQSLVDITGSWKDDQTLSATIESNLELLQEPEHISSISSMSPYKFTLRSNLTSTMANFESFRLNLHHSQFSSINFKTDLDIQLANEKEISMTSHLVLPQSFSDLLSTRVELHIKTPFVGYQNIDLQAILGRKEDKDVMALIGIYVESFQYSVAITGTPRFEEDGALGFEMTTSNPKYDKIFGRFSYVIGDNSRLACQLGWPQVVIGWEAGFESVGWEEFQLYLTFSSPWMPVKNINTLVKIDRAQFAEIKLELNEDGINAKSEWVVESWTSFDVRLDGSTPFEGARTFGGVLKHSWDDPATFYSQIAGWVDDQQAGYKLEGGTSEKEEECGFATVRYAQLEIDTVVYPTVRTTLNFSQMDVKYNLDMSILLREGPINVSAELEVLDVLRFNEKIHVTTPYPALFELEINLNPAIVPERDLYNLGLHSKWRSGSLWEEGGLVLRIGPQSEYSALITEDLENAAFLDCGKPEDNTAGVNEGDDDYRTELPDSATSSVDVAKSQLFHFYSPLKWANVVKLEYELVPKSLDSDVDGESEALAQQSQDDELVDQFPLRNFALVYRADNASISTILQNEALIRTLTASIDIPTWVNRLAGEIDCSLDLTESERKLNIEAASRHPSLRKYSLLSQWNNQLPQILSGNVEVSTPIEKFEQQSGSLMYAQSEIDQSYTVALELASDTFDKLATNFVIGPRHFSMTLNTPYENFQEIEMRADTTDNEESPDKLNSLVTIKNGEKEIEIDVDSEMANGWPTKIKGTVSATFGPSPYRRGNLKGNVERNDYDVNANGEIMWENAEELKAHVYFHQSREQLEQLKVNVNTTVKGLEHWELEVNRKSKENDARVVYDASGKTPYRAFSSVRAGLTFEKGEDWLQVKTLEINGQADNGSFSTESSWLMDKWNNFEVASEIKYEAAIGTGARAAYQFLRSLPAKNSLSFKLGNVIPSLSQLTSIDSKGVIEVEQPYFRVGQSLQVSFKPEEEIIFKHDSVFMRDSSHLQVNSEFDESFHTVASSAEYKSEGSVDRTYKINCNWNKVQESFVGDAGVVWGSLTFGTTSIHSKFNCSVNDASQDGGVLIHARVGSPVTSKGEADVDESREEDEDERTLNPLDNPMLTMDGTFNKISGRHSARIQFGQDGLDQIPLVTEGKLLFVGLNEFDAVVNFTSGIENFTNVGFHLANQNHGNIYDGIYGGHWEVDEAMLKYFVEFENKEGGLLLNLTLDGVIPISTEGVPKPQRAVVDVFYKGEEQSMESSLRGEYNGVQLFLTNYKSSSMSSAGLETEETELKFQNHFWPFGFNHTYHYEYNGGQDGVNLPSKSLHSVDIYNLNNTEQRLEGEMETTTNFTGKRIFFKVTHPSRKVYVITDYNLEDRNFLHTTSLSWQQESWLGYELALMNMTKDSGTDHRLSLKVNYPLRSIELNSAYALNENIFKWTTDLNLNATQSPDKVVSTIVLSLDPETSGDTLVGKTVATLKHPSLGHDIVAAGELTMVGLTASSSSPGRGRIDGIFSLEYSDDPKERLILNWDAKLDLHEILYGGRTGTSFIPSKVPYWELKSSAKVEHLATNLDLKALCSTHHSPHELSIITLMDFKNSVKNANQESKMAFEFFKESNQASIQMSDPEEYALFWAKLTSDYPRFVVNGKCNVTGISPSPEASISLDLEKSNFTMYAVHGKDLANGFFAGGKVVDSRNVVFDISEVYDNYRFSNVNFYLRLNHSRLISSKLKWRPELFSEIRDVCVNAYNNATAYAGAKCNKLWNTLIEDASQSTADVWTQMKPRMEPFLIQMKEDLNFTADVKTLSNFLIEMYDKNELYLQDIHDCVQLVTEEIYARLKASFERYRRELGNPAKILEKAFAWIVEKIQEIYSHLETTWKSYLNSGGVGFSVSFAKLRQLCFLYINDAIQLAEELILQVYKSLSTFTNNVYAHVSHLVEQYRPSVMAYFHQLEAAFHDVMVKVLDFFYETKEVVIQSAFYQKLAKLTQDLDELYKDVSKNSWESNIKKYYESGKNFLYRKLSALRTLHLSLGRTGERLESIVNDILETEVVQDFKEALKTAFEKLKYLIRYGELDVLIPKMVMTLISKGKSIFFMTAIDTAATFEKAKTRFIFDAGKGIISLEQKLPMPMAAFNETPNFRELPEYKAFLKAQDFFQSSDGSVLDVYYKLKSYTTPLDLIPPFEGHAMVVGSAYFFTFDGLVYNHSGRCVHLLVADLVDGNFSVSLQYENKSTDLGGYAGAKEAYNVIVASGHNTLIIDMKENGLKDPKRGLLQMVSLPVQMANLRGYRDAEILHVESPKGINVRCNVVYRVCQIQISGWYSRKLAGVLGTMDLEPFTDMMMANGKHAKNLAQFFTSWDVSDDSTDSCAGSSAPGSSETGVIPTASSSSRMQVISTSKSSCYKIFQSKHSSLQPCFSTVNVEPFIEMCLTEESQTDSVSSSLCTSAFAYSSQCRSRGVWVKIPSACIKCDMNGETMMDRDMKVISSPPSGSPAFRSTDVVFIVEAKECNRALRMRRKIDSIVNALDEEFATKNFKENRYAAVVYGGDGVLEKPHPIVQNRKIFTTSENISGYIASVVMGNGNKDTFQAIWYALQKLDFRPGVSKTFILLPCSSCNPKEMTIDFSAIHYAMLEQDAKLHILMNKDFLFDDKALAKRFFGYDASLGFTKSDGVKNRLRGNSEIRPQVFLPRKMLGYCAPLALETNGTIFSGKKLQNRREEVVKLFTTTFSRRIVQTAAPADCQTCYCLSNDDTGIGKIECFVCGYPRYKPEPDGYDENLIDTDSDVKPVDDDDDVYDEGVDEEEE